MQRETPNIHLETVSIGSEQFFKIAHADQLRPFFMSIVSNSNHWMFISSNGGVTAGRKNAEFALFPYYTDDKITETADITGSKSVFQIHKADKIHIWEPFSERFTGVYKTVRNLYKNIFGNKIIFEEINEDLGLCFRYVWAFSDVYGFVKTSTLSNLSADTQKITLLDGIQNIIPYGVGSDLQNSYSNLADAYKRNELLQDSSVGIFALSAIIVDKAEPSEALKANVAFSQGLENPKYLLSSLQLNNFRRQIEIFEEHDVKGEKGAYFVYSNLELGPQSEKSWSLVADVNKTQADIVKLSETLKSSKDLVSEIQNDIDRGTLNLIALNAAADGLQFTNDNRKDARHFSNVLFNIMRGGIFDHNYLIEKQDFENYFAKANPGAFERNKAVIGSLGDTFTLHDLLRELDRSADLDFKRLAIEYLPLKFSRRHGDPSRPWNKFSINTRHEIDGSKVLDYQGNWRDIFQNWEVLAHAYPDFVAGMIFKFLNASTFDGYNPYRITKGGFDWETIEHDDPWSYIGYWGDHQIIYLLKFLEFFEKHQPGALATYFTEDYFVYANVPYRIKSYAEILKNPKDTIVFDDKSDALIRSIVADQGADGALLTNSSRTIHHVNFIEKILATVLAKISNFIPEGGIWMNTQRPEWNDANNALVGNGVSMVTLYYLQRFLTFFGRILSKDAPRAFEISEELARLFFETNAVLEQHTHLLQGTISDADRKSVLDGLGSAAGTFRDTIYQNGFSGKKSAVTAQDLRSFVSCTTLFLEHSIRANKRADHLYHAYNLMTLHRDGIGISYLSEMLEGQVAVLSSGYLSPDQSLHVLDALRASALYRADQHSYILYPNINLPKFLEKNNIPQESVERSELLMQLVAAGNAEIINQDVKGQYHFNGNFRNANDLHDALNQLKSKMPHTASAQKTVLDIFEEVFNHKAFTGRSMTFYGYEGLGSIYWHMVSKLLLAVQEVCHAAIEAQADPGTLHRLVAHYEEINKGIGVQKSPDVYGAFPTDPYSHTPFTKGAQQPGMTGQVKEDILARFGELGVQVEDGKLQFNPAMLQRREFLAAPKKVSFVQSDGSAAPLALEKDSLAFSYCQVVVVYKIASANSIEVVFSNGDKQVVESHVLDASLSNKVFTRTGEIAQLHVSITENNLRND
jgi:hypothetical protein